MADNRQTEEIEHEISENQKNIDISKPLRTDSNEKSNSLESNKTKKQKLISKYFPTKVKIHTEPCTNINNMNDDCLSELFRGQFILQELMHLRRVCVQWQTIIEQLFAGKQFLKIFIQKDTFIEHFRAMNQMAEQARIEKNDEEGLFTLKSDSNGVDDVLVIKNLKSNTKLLTLTFISTLFPSIQYLFIVFPKNCRQHKLLVSESNCHYHLDLCDMLKQWSKLCSLSLKDISILNSWHIHWFDDRDFAYLLSKDLPQLSSLHLFGRCKIGRFLVQVAIRQLKRLTIAASGEQHVKHGEIVELMPLLSKCTRLISIGSVGLLCDECLAGGEYSKDNTQLTHLTFVEGGKFFNDFSRFKALTCLDVNLVQTFEGFIKILEKSTNLTELRIMLSGMIEISDQMQQQLSINLNQPIPVLSSVTSLHLRIFNSYIILKESPNRRLDPTFLKGLPQIFPNLKSAKMTTISQIVKTELEMCFKSRGPNHFPLLKSVKFLSSESELIDLAKYDGPYRKLVKSL